MDPEGRLLAAWEDGRDGDRDVRVSRSLDGGVTWEASRRADSDPPGAASSFHPQWCGAGHDVLLLLWWDDRNGLSDLYVRRSTDGGATWAGPEVRLDGGLPGASASHAGRWEGPGPGMVGKEPRVAVTWEEQDPARGMQEFLRESPDGGVSWLPAVAMPRPNPDPAAVRVLSAEGDTLIVRPRPSSDGDELRATLRRAAAARR
jgi:hypothetical protein